MSIRKHCVSTTARGAAMNDPLWVEAERCRECPSGADGSRRLRGGRTPGVSTNLVRRSGVGPRSRLGGGTAGAILLRAAEG